MARAQQQWQGWIQLLLGLGLTFLFFYMMAPFLVAILLGAVTAILCYPIYERLKRLASRPVAGILVTAGVALGILMPVIFVLYSGAYRLLTVFGKIKMPKGSDPMEGILHHPAVSKALRAAARITPVDREWVQTQLFSVLESIIENVSRVVTGFLSGMPGLLLGFSVVILSTYFFLVDGARFLRFLQGLSPLKQDRSMALYSSFESSCRGVVIGLLVSSIVQAFLMAIFFLITGLPSPLFTAVITSVMGMVPVVGSAPIWIGASLYLLLSGQLPMGIVMILGGVLISTSDNIVRPLVMRGQSEMHPLLALVSVFGAVDLLGPTGIFLGPIIAAVFVSFLKIITLEIRRESIPYIGRKPSPA